MPMKRLSHSVIFVAVTVLSCLAARAAGWEKLPSLPVPNAGFACGVLGDKIVVLGGTNWTDDTKHWLDAIWVFDTTSLQWRPHGVLPHPLAYSVTSRINDGLLIAGGSDGTQPRREIWLVKPSLELVKTGLLDEGAALSLGGVVDDRLLMLGGCADVAKLDGMRKGGRQYHLHDKGSSALPPAGDHPSGLGAMAVAGRELFIFGGAMHDPVKLVANLDNAWAFDAAKGTWRALKAYPFAVRGATTLALDEHRILIAGGCGGEPEHFIAEAFVYDVRRDAYTQAMDLPQAALAALVMNGDYVYCLGGEDRKKHRTDACWRIRVGDLLSPR